MDIDDVEVPCCKRSRVEPDDAKVCPSFLEVCKPNLYYFSRKLWCLRPPRCCSKALWTSCSQDRQEDGSTTHSSPISQTCHWVFSWRLRISAWTGKRLPTSVTFSKLPTLDPNNPKGPSKSELRRLLKSITMLPKLTLTLEKSLTTRSVTLWTERTGLGCYTVQRIRLKFQMNSQWSIWRRSLLLPSVRTTIISLPTFVSLATSRVFGLFLCITAVLTLTILDTLALTVLVLENVNAFSMVIVAGVIAVNSPRKGTVCMSYWP